MNSFIYFADVVVVFLMDDNNNKENVLHASTKDKLMADNSNQKYVGYYLPATKATHPLIQSTLVQGVFKLNKTFLTIGLNIINKIIKWDTAKYIYIYIYNVLQLPLQRIFLLLDIIFFSS